MVSWLVVPIRYESERYIVLVLALLCMYSSTQLSNIIASERPATRIFACFRTENYGYFL